MTKLLGYLKGYRLKTIFGPLFKLIEAVFELITPLIVAYIIDEGIPAAKNGDISLIVRGGVIIITLGALGLAFALTAQYFASRASLGFGTNLRRELYAHVNRFSYAELDKFSTASLITRITGDVNQCQQGVAMFIRLVLRAPFIAAGAIIMAVIIDAKLSLIFVGATALIGATLYFIMTFTMPKYKTVQEKLDDVTRLTRENLSGARVVRAFGAEEREKSAFRTASDALAEKSIKAGVISALLNPLTYAVANVAIILILYFGGKTVYLGHLTQGSVIALVNYMTQILNAMIVFANLMVTFTKASASAARINEVFAVSPTLKDGDGATPDYNSPAIELKNVTFKYNENAMPALDDISVTIKKGQSVGILGGTGSGKTALINLITRLYDVTSGEIKIFGNDVKNYTFKELSEIFGVVPQKAVLFKGTLRENMQFKKEDATDDEIYAAIDDSCSRDFVDKLKGGLEAQIEQDGKNVSGGQRQRLTIARALIGSPKILLLDDSMSALDYKTDATLRKNLSRLQKDEGLTAVNVSQRVQSVRYSDVIIVLDDGKLAAVGTHEELINSSPVYREIFDSQQKGAPNE